MARAQASGLWSDRSAIERGTASRRVHQTELLRIWTTLLSYMLAKANLAYEKTQSDELQRPGAGNQVDRRHCAAFSIEAMLTAALRGQ